MEVWSASSSEEKRQRGERTSKKRKSPELEDLKQAPGHAGVEEVHLSGVDFLQQEQQSSTPPPLPAVPHSPQSHLSLMALHPLYPSPISEQRGGASPHGTFLHRRERGRKEKRKTESSHRRKLLLQPYQVWTKHQVTYFSCLWRCYCQDGK